ncbi:unnamed protein product [Cuscuta epithymum]|uniref:Uncharacterized protein n=1 Tax=Cuscuta epithymum TaxID=186058 RepID=A0AAV0F8E7_9ASTE|nr:unnamed protein product [Cuscuta epithymum]
MDSCVLQLLEQKDDDEPEWEWDLEYHENIRFCKGYFGYFLFFYDYEDRLTPEFIHVMRHFEKYYTLDWYPKRILLCLLTTKRSRQDCFHLSEDREHILKTPPLLDFITDDIDLK